MKILGSGDGMARKPKLPKEIAYDFIKSNFFRVVHADGVFGGLAPNGNIHMQVYSERKAIPQKTVHAVESGELGPEIHAKRQERKAVVREVEVDVVFNIAQAEAMRAWLADKIDTFQKITGTHVPPMHMTGGMLKPVGNGSASKQTAARKK